MRGFHYTGFITWLLLNRLTLHVYTLLFCIFYSYYLSYWNRTSCMEFLLQLFGILKHVCDEQNKTVSSMLSGYKSCFRRIYFIKRIESGSKIDYSIALDDQLSTNIAAYSFQGRINLAFGTYSGEVIIFRQ